MNMSNLIGIRELYESITKKPQEPAIRQLKESECISQISELQKCSMNHNKPSHNMNEIEVINLYMMQAGKSNISDVSFSISDDDFVYVNYYHEIIQDSSRNHTNIEYKEKSILIGTIKNGISFNDYIQDVISYFESPHTAIIKSDLYNSKYIKNIQDREKIIDRFLKLRSNYC